MKKINPVVCLNCDGILFKLLDTRIKCIDCGAEFTLHKVKPLSEKIDRICVTCDKPFQTTQARKKTCSRECQQKWVYKSAIKNVKLRRKKNKH